MDPRPYQQHAGLQHAVLQPQQEVTRPKARFKPTSLEKSGVDGGAIRCQHFAKNKFFSSEPVSSDCTAHVSVALSVTFGWIVWTTLPITKGDARWPFDKGRRLEIVKKKGVVGVRFR